MNDTLKRLQRLTEKRLIEVVLQPVIQALGFDWIENRHGVLERGVDLLCGKVDELGELDLLAIQVKRLKFTGRVTDSAHLYPVLTQLAQCLIEPIRLRDGTERCANRVWLVSPYEFVSTALDSAFARFQQARLENIRIVDGTRLLSLIQKHAPQTLVMLGDNSSLYVMNVRRDVALLHEAAVFHMTGKPSLSSLYVELGSSLVAGH
jgi:hypothetical protein